MTNGFPKRGSVARRRRRLGPQLRDCMKDLCEILVAYHVGASTESLERALVIWWMKWFVVAPAGHGGWADGKSEADTQGQDSLFPGEAKTDEVAGVYDGGDTDDGGG